MEPAIAAYQKQIEINPYDEYAFNNLGRAYRFLHKYDELRMLSKKQIEVNLLDQQARENLGFLYVDWKKYDSAVTELETA